MLERWYSDSSSERIRKWTSQFLSHSTCPECNGYRLKKESLHFKIDNRHIGEIAHLDLDELAHWLKDLPDRLKDRKSTRLNSSHVAISYAVFCLKKKKNTISHNTTYTQRLHK